VFIHFGLSCCSNLKKIIEKRSLTCHPNLISLSLIGISSPLVSLYLPRTKSETCSSFACSTADSLSWGPWPRKFSYTKSIPEESSTDKKDERVMYEPLSSIFSFFSHFLSHNQLQNSARHPGLLKILHLLVGLCVVLAALAVSVSDLTLSSGCCCESSSWRNSCQTGILIGYLQAGE